MLGGGRGEPSPTEDDLRLVLGPGDRNGGVRFSRDRGLKGSAISIVLEGPGVWRRRQTRREEGELSPIDPLPTLCTGGPVGDNKRVVRHGAAMTAGKCVSQAKEEGLTSTQARLRQYMPR
jgi:hypothetical protein